MLDAKTLAKIAKDSENESLRESFRDYFKKFAYPFIHPGNKLVDTWSIDCLCEYGQALADGDIKD